MNWKTKTKAVAGLIIFAIIAILIYDAVAIHFGGTEASISSLIIVNSYEYPFMVFCIGLFIGILAGHLFWRMKPNKDTIGNGIDKLP